MMSSKSTTGSNNNNSDNDVVTSVSSTTTTATITRKATTASSLLSRQSSTKRRRTGGIVDDSTISVPTSSSKSNAIMQRRQSTSASSLSNTKKLTTTTTKKDEATTTTTKEFVRDPLYMYSSLIAGIGSGAISGIVCAPLDLIKTRMQIWGSLQQQGVTNSFVKTAGNSGVVGIRSVFRMLQDIIHTEGIVGCFRGLGATLITVPAFWGVYCTYFIFFY
jgi:hypothetical protein